MHRTNRWKKVLLGALGAMALGLLQVPTPCHAFEVEIDVAPNVLNIQSEGTVVTVHTNLPYSYVEGSTVTLNDVEIISWKSDVRGNFVAKFDILEIKNLVDDEILEIGVITLKLEGTYWAGTDAEGDPIWVDFLGGQDIFVIDNVPVAAGR